MAKHEIPHTSPSLAEEAQAGRCNKRNGFSAKRVHTGGETLPLSIPRDRNGDFEPQLISPLAADAPNRR